VTREIELDLLDYCQQGLLVGPDSTTSTCATGKRFATFRTRVTAECEIGTDYTTLFEAEKIFREAFAEYKAENPGRMLYWRMRPKVETRRLPDAQNRFSIYARLCIDQPKE